jgi:perosamine synthetase
VSAQIPNAVPFLGGNEWRYLKECLDTNWVSSVGPFVEKFEAGIAAYCDVRHAIATVNGSAALHVALAAAGVGRDDEVLVPALTFVATANAVAYCGARPVFMDVVPSTWTLDPAKVEDFLHRECQVKDGRVVNRATGRVVRAVLPVHLYGHPADLDALAEVCGRLPLQLVEDSAEALGARYKGRRVGAHGLVGCLSFNGNKIITSGSGGMVLTNDDALARRVRSLTTQARLDGPDWVHGEVGYNYRLSNLHAALGLAQLEQLDRFLAAKRETAGAYTAAFRSIDGVTPLAEQPWAESSFWMYSVLLDPPAFGPVHDVIRAAAAAGVQLRPLWFPLQRQPAFAGCQAYRVEVADALHAHGVSLPCSVGITPAERETVIRLLRERPWSGTGRR